MPFLSVPRVQPIFFLDLIKNILVFLFFCTYVSFGLHFQPIHQLSVASCFDFALRCLIGTLNISNPSVSNMLTNTKRCVKVK
jgi:hypothetical protein